MALVPGPSPTFVFGTAAAGAHEKHAPAASFTFRTGQRAVKVHNRLALLPYAHCLAVSSAAMACVIHSSELALLPGRPAGATVMQTPEPLLSLR